MKTKKLFSSLVLAMLLLAMLTGTSEAVVQSRPDLTSLTMQTASDFFKYIRQMETSSGPMGLDATVDDTGTETSSSNNIDVHMIKNTEWGTVAMLAGSSYGAVPTSKNDSTTGNSYGVYKMAQSQFEYISAIWDKNNSYNTNIYNAEAKYKDVYTEVASKTGDATLETKGWKGSHYAFVSEAHPVFSRGSYGLFAYANSYDLKSTILSNSSGDGRAASYFSSRVTVVCGSGF